jgi:PhzF family phenazine biosynthesis protein
MDLCGHATLATAHVIFNHEEWSGKEINFHTISGLLQVKKDEKLLTLDFPARAPQAAVLPVELELGLDILPVAVYKARDFLLLYNNEDEIKKIKPNRYYFDQVNLDPGGVIITAPGDEVDFVSRFFTPQASIFEDPVTGSAHCTLIPFWANRLGKNKMDAIQLSNRIGYLYCVNAGDRVQIKGNAITYSKSVLFITDNFFLNSK